MSSKGVTIQLVDVVATSYSPPLVLKQSEPVVLRREQAIKTITGLTKPSYRLGLSVIDNNALASDSELSTAIVQYPTVDEINQLESNLSQGFVNVTVKYSLMFNASGTAPYYVTASGYPAGTTFISGDLALAPYDHELIVGQEWFSDAGDRNGVIPVAGTATLTGENYSLYRYDGTGWLPCVLDTNVGISKYRVKVENDYAYLCTLCDTTDPTLFGNLRKSNTTNYYEMIYYPNVPSAGITRSVRFPKMFEIEARVEHLKNEISNNMSNFDCGTAEV